MDNKFFTFFNSFFAYIDQGKLYRKPFSWLYGFNAIVNLLLPIFALVGIINMFKYASGGQVVGFILIWLVIALAGWFSFQLWWNRMNKVANLTRDNDDFVATPVVAHLLQTFGEWLGCYLGGVGCLASLIALIFGADLSRLTGSMNFAGAGAAGIITMPIIGFLILVFFRYLAEMIRALASIANNTKKTNNG